VARSLSRCIALCGALALAAVVASCGGDDEEEAATTTRVAPPQTVLANACPPDGCRARIVDATRAGAELRLTFDANFAPDMSRNHLHVYWDHFAANQVSDDAERRFGVTQGDWVPTADNPYTTGDAVSVSVRGESKRVCVTAGDRDHNVLDPSLVDCRDVSSLLGG
jgi:hypothetical protein